MLDQLRTILTETMIEEALHIGIITIREIKGELSAWLESYPSILVYSRIDKDSEYRLNDASKYKMYKALATKIWNNLWKIADNNPMIDQWTLKQCISYLLQSLEKELIYTMTPSRHDQISANLSLYQYTQSSNQYMSIAESVHMIDERKAITIQGMHKLYFTEVSEEAAIWFSLEHFYHIGDREYQESWTLVKEDIAENEIAACRSPSDNKYIKEFWKCVSGEDWQLDFQEDTGSLYIVVPINGIQTILQERHSENQVLDIKVYDNYAWIPANIFIQTDKETTQIPTDAKIWAGRPIYVNRYIRKDNK